ncbi:MAG: trypsin-like peptidase domain-containing protein [Rhodothermales bacterium]
MPRPAIRLSTVLLTFLVFAGCRQPAQSQIPPGTDMPPPQRVEPPAAPGVVTDGIYQQRQTAITRAVEHVAPAVVSINVIEVRQVRVRDPFSNDPFFEYFFGQRQSRVQQQQVQGVGSGFVISPDGYIVTNDHVAGNATRITVSFPDGRELDGRLVGTDPESDVALIKVEPDAPLAYLAFTESENLYVGEWAIALGNPFGLFEAAEPTVTVGVISAVGRDFAPQEGRVFRDMIQTDAAINRGNSGGPLVNALGEVIGVNTFIFSRSGGSVGIGFATPAWRVRRIVDEIRETGRVARPAPPGLNVRALNARAARMLDLDVDAGLLVISVDPDSPAEAAGIQPYDVILAVDGQGTPDSATASALLRSRRPGETVQLRVLRDGEEREVALVLAATP